MGWDYSEKTRRIFLDAVHGRPGTHMGEIQDPDGFGEHGSIACGDALRFTFRVEKHPEDPMRDVIVEARYLTFGCTSAIAASEALCSIIEEGRFSPRGALRISNQDIVDFLEGLPEQKIHCSVMGAEALEAAVFNWAQKRGVDLRSLGVDTHPEEQEEGRIVCKCFTLTEPYIRRKIRELKLKTIPEITGAIKAGGACMSCHHVPGGLQDILNEVWAADEAARRLGMESEPVVNLAGPDGQCYAVEESERPKSGARPATGAAARLTPAGATGGEPSAAAGGEPRATAGGEPRATAGGEPRAAAGGEPRATTGGEPRAAAGGEPTPAREALSPYRFAKEIEKTLDQYIRPLLQRDGGDIELIDVKDRLVYCRLLGHCAGCGASEMTLRVMVEKTLRERVDDGVRVISV